MAKLSLNEQRKSLYNSTKDMPKELLKPKKYSPDKLIKQVIGNNGKYIKVQYIGLPTQDYAKAKVIVSTLLLYEYCEIQVLDVNEFIQYVDLLTEYKSFFVVKDKGILKWVNVCKTK